MTGNQTFCLFSEWRERGKELENTGFNFPELYLLKLGQHPEKKKVGFIGLEDNKQKSDAIAESVDTLLQHSKVVF